MGKSDRRKGDKVMIIYIAGAIASRKDTYKEVFAKAQRELEEKGHIVINPALLPEGLDGKSYMPICMAMIDAVDAVFMLRGWVDSPGARCERHYALYQRKKILYEEDIMYSEKDNDF